MQGETQANFVLEGNTDEHHEQQHHTEHIQPDFHQPPPAQEIVRDPLDQLKAAIDLAQTMPPSKLRKNLIGLITLAPEIEDHLLQKIDLPMEIDSTDPQNLFLKTEFNRDGDSYRSPVTNTYFPHANGYTTSGEYRRIEQIGQVLFNEYTKLYYGNTGVGSFFVSQGNNHNSFSCGYFAKKNCEEQNEHGFEGNWDSFNIVDITINGDQATYKLQSTILIQMKIQQAGAGSIDLTGFLKKSKTQKKKLHGNESANFDSHLLTVCEMIEQMETTMRQHLEAVYVARTKEVIFSTRYEYTVEYQNNKKNLAEGLRKIHIGQK